MWGNEKLNLVVNQPSLHPLFSLRKELTALRNEFTVCLESFINNYVRFI